MARASGEQEADGEQRPRSVARQLAETAGIDLSTQPVVRDREIKFAIEIFANHDPRSTNEADKQALADQLEARGIDGLRWLRILDECEQHGWLESDGRFPPVQRVTAAGRDLINSAGSPEFR